MATRVSTDPLTRYFSAIVISLVLALTVPSALWAQSQPLNFENNFFVTGDYLVAGWANKQVDANRAGYATGTISIPDTTQSAAIKNAQAGVPTQVPTGADIVAAYVYWMTVEKDKSTLAGQVAYFNGHAMNGVPLDQSAPVSWSSGGCAGAANGTSTMRVYRANVRGFLPVGPGGIVQPNTSYTLELADSGSNGKTAPFTLGASMLIVYRVLSPKAPLNAIVVYDGAFAPSNASSSMSQLLQGFYQPTPGAFAKLTHIVGNGQSKKSETVSLNSLALQSLYGAKAPAFPGVYNGSWDNPTWNVTGLLNGPPSDPSDTTSVAPGTSNGGCVSWGAIVFSTTVQDSDGDGLLDYWEQSPTGPNPPPTSVNPGPGAMNPHGDPGYIDIATGQFVALPGADPQAKNLFIQVDSMCSGNVVLNADNTSTCDTSGGTSFLPSADALKWVSDTFAGKGINVHFETPNAIPEGPPCTDTTDASGNKIYCSYPNQAGVVGWKSGFTFLKNQPINYPDESSCETQTPPNGAPGSGPACVRRFQYGRKDSWHYVIAANALGAPNWTFAGGNLTSIVVDNNGVATFTTTVPSRLTPNDSINGPGRITVSDALTPNLNGVFFVTSVTNGNPGDAGPHTFQVLAPGVAAGTYNLSTDPNLGVASGQGGTGSGYSDLGGQDSLITLGLWPPALGTKKETQAGTFMHELGHTLALPHGGDYADTQNSSVLTFEPNCKPNYQSIMNYLFQVDLLEDSAGNSVLDYSEQNLTALNLNFLNEQTIAGVAGLSLFDGTAPTYARTKWYTANPENLGNNPSSAKGHCDGTPLSPQTDPQPTMYRIEGDATAISPLWSNGQDINFNGAIDTELRGFDDWAHLDLQQIGATGSLSVFAGSTTGFGGSTTGFGGSTTGFGGSTTGFGGSTTGFGGSTTGFGGSTTGFGGIGNGEFTFEAANSVVRAPRKLTATPSDLRVTHSVTLGWSAPTFGEVASYNIYRGLGGATPTLYHQTSGDSTPTATSYTDTNVTDCTTYTYFVTTVLTDGRESVGSNSATYFDPCAPQGLTSPSTAASQVPLTWTPPSSGDVAYYNVYRATGNGITDPNAFALLHSTSGDAVPTATSYTDTGTGAFTFTNNTDYSYVVTAVLKDLTGCSGSPCRESSDSNTTTTKIHFTVNPVVVWPSASGITYGQTLASSPLSGGSASDPSTGKPVDGAFAFVDTTIAPPVGSYLASVKFTPVDTYDYNVVTGSVYVAVSKGATTTTITGITANPNPPMLGQTITVNFSVSPVGATGTVTVTEDSGASCTGNVGTNGAGTCQLTLNVLTSSLKSAVGSRLLTGVYSGDPNYAQSQTSSGFPVQVIYRFTGFLSPLNGTVTYGGAFNLGKALPLKWQLTNAAGTTFITMSNLNLNNLGRVNVLLQAFYNGPAQNNGKCGLPSLTNYGGTSPIPLFSPAFGVTGNSNFRYDSTNNQFIFNWDTTVNSGAGCYTVALWLDDVLPQPPGITSRPVWATSIQLK